MIIIVFLTLLLTTATLSSQGIPGNVGVEGTPGNTAGEGIEKPGSLSSSSTREASSRSSVHKRDVEYTDFDDDEEEELENELEKELLEAGRRIVGGIPVEKIEEFPFLIFIRMKQSSSPHHCGGTLIRQAWVLTAAHCMFMRGIAKSTEIKPARLEVVAGQTNVMEVGRFSKVRSVKESYVHSEFRSSSTDDGDIALLKLSQKFELSSDVKLAKIGTVLAPNVYCTVVGWGSTRIHATVGSRGGRSGHRSNLQTQRKVEVRSESDPRQQADVKETHSIGSNLRSRSAFGLRVVRRVMLELLKVNVPLVTQDNCKKALARSMSAGVLCAGGNEGDACQGDSGGPLICNDFQAGLVSWGNGCGNPGVPAKYTKIEHYIVWINDTIDKTDTVFSSGIKTASVIYPVVVFHQIINYLY